MEKGGHQVDLLGAVNVGGTTGHANGHAWSRDVLEPICHFRVSSVAGRGAYDVSETCWPQWGPYVELNQELDGLDEVAPRDRLVR